MPGGKGKSIGGKGGAKDSSSGKQKSHSAKAGLQVSGPLDYSRYTMHVVATCVPCLGGRIWR